MPTIVPGSPCEANYDAADIRRESSDLDPSGEISADLCSFAVAVRKVWHVKAPAAIASHTGRSERTCRDWTSARSDAPSSVFIALIRSKEGYRVLSAIMKSDPPQWWVNLQAQIRNGERASRFKSEIE